ncbi:MAG: hypothetical protein U1B78_06570 [Dehalococcoidia bacterium]|nr:hypothetical protein [Dehalococcoidia bacterium]
MTAPTEHERRVPPYVALVRIAAVVGMSAAAAFGIFLLLLGAGYWYWGLLCIAGAVPFFFLMRLFERTAEPPEPPESPVAD